VITYCIRAGSIMGVLNIIIISLLLSGIFSVSFAAEDISTNSNGETIKNKSTDKENAERGVLREKSDPFAGRNYLYPSIMVKDDMNHFYVVDGKYTDPLMGVLYMRNWEIVKDKYDRWCRYVSPVMTLQELQNMLNFHDEDLKPIVGSSSTGPHAHIVTDWLICEVTYIDKHFDGTDKTIKVKAVVIDVEKQKAADAHAEYDKNKGFIRTILDMFSDKAHVK